MEWKSQTSYFANPRSETFFVLRTGKYYPPADRSILPVDSPIREWKVLPRRNKAEQHTGDLAEVAGTRNVY